MFNHQKDAPPVLDSLKEVKINYHVTSLQQMFKREKEVWRKDFTIEDNQLIAKNYKVTDLDIKHIWAKIRKSKRVHCWKEVKSLNFCLAWCENITYRSLDAIGLQIGRHFNKLQKLKFTFNGCKLITDKGLCQLGSRSIRGQTNLHQISIVLDSCSRITDDGLKIIGYEFTKHSSNLQSILLDLTFCERITNDGLKALGSQIRKNSLKLQNLTLAFGLLGDDALQSIKPMISFEFSHLKMLNLCFSGCKDITNAGLEIIADAIHTNFENLNRLILDFSNCYRITSKGLLSLGFGVLDRPRKLNEFKLALTMCRGIDPKDISLMKDMMKVIPDAELIQNNKDI